MTNTHSDDMIDCGCCSDSFEIDDVVNVAGVGYLCRNCILGQLADMTARRDAWREMAYALKAKEKTYNMWICCAGKLNEQDARARLRELGEIK